MDLAGARAFIDDRFLRAYGARNAASFVEHLGVARGDTGRAVLGYRRAGSEPLFTERYLDQSIEEAVSAAFGRTVERHRIVEIGNLAADNAWSMGISRSGVEKHLALAMKHLRQSLKDCGFFGAAASLDQETAGGKAPIGKAEP